MFLSYTEKREAKTYFHFSFSVFYAILLVFIKFVLIFGNSYWQVFRMLDVPF